MKQGSGKTTLDYKTEPKSHAASETAAAQLGLTVNYRKHPLYEGRGLEAPKVSSTTHKSGSQGRR